MYEVKFNKINALAQEYDLSNTQVEILKFYVDPDNKYTYVYDALEKLGIKDTFEARMDIEWLMIWKLLRQTYNSHPVPLYLGF